MTGDETCPGVLLVGGAGPAPLGIDVAVMAIEQARSRGLSVHLMGHAPDLEKTRVACRLADTVSAVDFEDVDAAVSWAQEQTAAGRSFDVVFTGRELALPATARIAEALGAAGNRPEVIDLIRAKDRCRGHLTAAGFRQPVVRLCGSLADARKALADNPQGPWVVKPRVGGGSEGVSLVSDPRDLSAAVSNLPPADREAFLVEEFVRGQEYSVEGLFRGGRPEVLAITAKDKMPPPFFVEAGHVLPAPLPERVRIDIEDTVVRALDCLGLSFGLFHVELWRTGHGLVLGEVHARLGGDYIHRMLAHAIDGLEMFGEVYDDALGRPAVARELRCSRAGASRYFTASAGRLVTVKGWEEASSRPDVLAAELNVAPGDLIGPVRDSDDRIGALSVGATSPQEASDLVSDLIASVKFVVEPEDLGTR